MMSYKGALDFSCAEAAFAVADNEKSIIIEENFTFPARDASRLPLVIKESLERKSLDFNSITEWSVGAGPGSFTGLRLASSFVMGLAFGRPQVKRRAVSSSVAIAESANATADKVLVLYDGRKNEIFAYGLKKQDGFYREDGFMRVIRNLDDARETAALYGETAAYTVDADACMRVTSEDFAKQILRATHIKASHLIFADPDDFSRPLTELVYQRPAVFTEAVRHRKFD